MHGDHVLGITSMLLDCSGVHVKPGQAEVDVYGPLGLRQLIYTSFYCTHAKRSYLFRVTELSTRLQMAANAANSQSQAQKNFVTPGIDDVYTVYVINNCFDNPYRFENQKYIVRAKIIQHTVPCFGYVVEEKARPGTYVENDCLVNICY